MAVVSEEAADPCCVALGGGVLLLLGSWWVIQVIGMDMQVGRELTRSLSITIQECCCRGCKTKQLQHYDTNLLDAAARTALRSTWQSAPVMARRGHGHGREHITNYAPIPRGNPSCPCRPRLHRDVRTRTTSCARAAWRLLFTCAAALAPPRAALRPARPRPQTPPATRAAGPAGCPPAPAAHAQHQQQRTRITAHTQGSAHSVLPTQAMVITWAHAEWM